MDILAELHPRWRLYAGRAAAGFHFPPGGALSSRRFLLYQLRAIL